MGGSQLKNLKAALKAHNLTGQTNIKKGKRNSKRQPKKYDREEQAKVIAQIREEFNPFEVKTSRNKRNATSAGNGKNDRVAVGKPGISKQIGEDQRKQAFEARMARKNKNSGFIDRRFGERNRDLSEEDKMLERFTRERQSQAKGKPNLFDLNDDSGDEHENVFGSGLTHLGESLALEEDFESGDLGFNDQGKRHGANDHLGSSDEPARKKTKAEVMKEVIAKSKFYKHERQKAQEKLTNQIDDLDEDFDDIFSELKDSENAVIKTKAKDSVNNADQEYDMKVRELTMERRAVPTDRTKTEEELVKEAEEKKKKLEQQRLDRMSGIIEADNGEVKGVEDLDDGFWGNSEEEVDDEESGDIADSDDDIEWAQESIDGEQSERKSIAAKSGASLPCPADHDELLAILGSSPLNEHSSIIKKIVSLYQPKLAEGNKERLGRLTGVVLRHILFLSCQEYSTNVQKFSDNQDSLVSILKVLSEKYNQALSAECRTIISEIQKRFKKRQFSGLNIGDLVFFALVGTLFSTSDQYHLVVTPCSILIAEFLEQIKFNSLSKLAFGSILVRLTIQYQRIAKRYVPEVTLFFEKVLATFLYNIKDGSNFNIKLDSYELGFPADTNFSGTSSHIIRLHEIFDFEQNNTESKITILLNTLDSLDSVISAVWKDLPAFTEITLNIQNLLEGFCKRYATFKMPQNILEKLKKLQKFNEHIPLTLQDHKPLSIPSHAPKFEENFNPDKKSYDPDRERSEINKMKNLIKKERKFTMKEIRKDNRFESRQRIDEQKNEASKYHAKMAHIINTINTEEGAEANKYERERKLRAGKK